MATEQARILIIGGGAAGHACAAALRRSEFPGVITVVDDEPGGAITRTLVDTGVLPGLLTAEQIRLPRTEGVEYLTGRAEHLEGAGALDGRPAVLLADGRRLAADAVVLACGSAVRGAPSSWTVDHPGLVHVLHTAADAEALRGALSDPSGRRIAVLGAGFIGTEVATHFVGAGAEVVLVGRSEAPLRAAVGGAVAQRLGELHRAHVDARLGVDVVAIRELSTGTAPAGPEITEVAPEDGARVAARAVEIELSDGSRAVVDAVVLAHGTDPATAWAGAPGGMRVSEQLRVAGERGLYAAGGAAVLDVAGHPVRIDHWDDSAAQGAHVAATVLHDLGWGDDPGPYLPRAGFTLMAYGAAVAGRGVPLPGAEERERPVEASPGAAAGVLAEFVAEDGRLCAIAGIGAGPAVARAAAELFAPRS